MDALSTRVIHSSFHSFNRLSLNNFYDPGPDLALNRDKDEGKSSLFLHTGSQLPTMDTTTTCSHSNGTVSTFSNLWPLQGQGLATPGGELWSSKSHWPRERERTVAEVGDTEEGEDDQARELEF